MSVNKYTTASGLQTLANGSRIWIGTKAAYEAAKQAGTLPNDCLIAITDDEASPFDFDDKEFVTTGLTYANAEYFRGGYMKVGSLVFVDMSIEFLTTPTSYFSTHPEIQGLPQAKDMFAAVPWVDNNGNYGTVRMASGEVRWPENSGAQSGCIATITFTYVAGSSE